jgi:hypothetical protein
MLTKGESVSELEYDITIETFELCCDHATSILGVNLTLGQQEPLPQVITE